MKIGITPRFQRTPSGVEIYGYDKDLLQMLINFEVTLLNPELKNPLDYIDLLVLSGGPTPGEDPIRDAFELQLIELAKFKRLSIIGICRGAEILAVSTGSELIGINNHINSLRDLTNDIKPIGKCFHSYAIPHLNSEWEIISRDLVDRTIEIFKHKVFNFVGVMSHPERSDNPIEGLNLIMDILLND